MGTNNSQHGDDALDRERALDTNQVSELLGLSPITLGQMRARGDGPRFFRASKRQVRYRGDARTVGRKAAP